MTQQAQLWDDIAQTQERQWAEQVESVPAMREQLLARHRAEETRPAALRIGASVGAVAIAAGVLFFLFRGSDEHALKLAREPIAALSPAPTVAPIDKVARDAIRIEATQQGAEHGATAVPLSPSKTSTLARHVTPAAPDVASQPPEAAVPSLPSWSELAAAGEHRAALDVAEEQGFDALCAMASLDELLTLAAAARFAGEPQRSRQALTSIRSRFKGQPRASLATFALGRLEADGRGDHAEAARYFKSYLNEQPNGALASVAAGRLMESSKKCGNLPQARAAARAYLERFSDGPHAALARSLSERDEATEQ